MSRSLYSKLRRTYRGAPSGAERREITLQQKSKLLSQFEAGRLRAAPKKSSYVIVIGAGFAGLSAAYHLVCNNHTVTVLEAGKRAGGRVLSKRGDFASGQVIEFGAELIGANHPLWVELALKFGLSFNVVTDDDMFERADLFGPLIIGGRSIDGEPAEKLALNMERAMRLLDMEGENVIADAPWDSPNAKELDGQLLCKWFERKVPGLDLPPDEAELLLEALNAEFTNDNAVSWKTQSLLAVLSQIKAHGGSEAFGTFTEVYRCSAGNDMLSSNLITRIGADNIRLNEPAIDIILDVNNVHVVTKPDKKVYTADYVVLAAPPTMWEKITKDPEILKLRSQTGPAVKFMAAVSHRFWIKHETAPSGLAGDVGMTWEGTDNQTELPGKQIDLSCFAGGDFAAKILAESDRDAFYDKQLDEIFTGFNQAVQKRHFQSWPEQPYIKTGYSFPGKDEVCSKIKCLNQAYKKRLFFAGEHTCAGFWGFMEGALKSGKIAAENIQAAAAENAAGEDAAK